MNQQAQSSLNAVSILGIAFVILKLTGYISWSWWWVTAPFWGPTALGAAILAGIALCWFAALAVTTAALFFRKKKK